MSNYGYGHQPTNVTNTDLTDLECFDLCGPLLRAAIRDARVMWSAKNLFIEGMVKRGWSDERIATHVNANDVRQAAILEKERDTLTGVWSLDGFEIKDNRWRPEPRLVVAPKDRAARLKAAADRALARSKQRGH
jgi:hypothetical protein